MNKIKVAFWLFIVVSIFDIIGILFKIPTLIFIFKPLILLSLLVLYSISVSLKNKWYVLALVFSFFGDVFLMFSGQSYFIIGLISFLIAHVLFIKIVISRIKNTTVLKVIYSIIPFLIIYSLLLFTLKDSLNGMLIPVIIYGFTISIFGTVSLIDYLGEKSNKTLLMLFGSIVFIISDSVLAIDKFYFETHTFKVMIMFTYVLAQYLIYRSMIIGAKKINVEL